MAATTIPSIFSTKFSSSPRTLASSNRCISSNLIVVHQDGGKPPIVTKQSSFNVTIDGRVTESPKDEDIIFEGIETDLEEEDKVKQEETKLKMDKKREDMVSIKVTPGRNACEALRESARILKWKILPKNEIYGDIYWHTVSFEECPHVGVTEQEVFAVNKLPGMLELSHKVHLSRILKRMQLLYPGEFDFYAPTWIIPEQYHQFVGEASISKTTTNGRYTPNGGQQPKTPPKAYIVKPDAGRQGDGIYLATHPRDVQFVAGMKPAIVQEYIANPILLDGFKFDLRIYVSVVRLHPLEVYICKEGLVRLCTMPYDPPSKKNINNSYMHLTNYSLNRFSDDYVHTDSGGTGSKRLLSSVERTLAQQGYDIKLIREQIADVAVKTILAFLPDLTVWDYTSQRQDGTRCFQILGFDIMLTSDMKAHLIEVNAAPSLRMDADQETEPGSGVMESVISAVDKEVKVNVIKDTMDIVINGEREDSDSCMERVFPKVRKDNKNKTVKSGSKIKLDQNKKFTNQQKLSQQKQVTDEQTTAEKGKLQRCKHCNTVYRKPSKQITVTYDVEEDPVVTSDWNFFDARSSGISLIAHDRQPMIISSYPMKQSLSTKNNTPTSEKHESVPGEIYQKCENCKMYLNVDVGPGILKERRIKKEFEEWKYQEEEAKIQRSLSVQQLNHFNRFTDSSFRSLPNVPQTETTFWDVLNDVRKMASKRNSKGEDYGNISLPNRENNVFRHDRYNRKIHKPKHDKNTKHSFQKNYAMLLDRVANIFIYFNGIKPKLTMSATSFRNMARKCELCDPGALPSIDILFIDTLRQWQNYRIRYGSPFYNNPSCGSKLKSLQETGLPFQGFIEAIFRIASQRYRAETLRDKLEILVENCEIYIRTFKKRRTKNTNHIDITMTLSQKEPKWKSNSTRKLFKNGCYNVNNSQTPRSMKGKYSHYLSQ